ncbi:MAG: RHS repeat-associated core domain-containing protein [bacterium]
MEGRYDHEGGLNDGYMIGAYRANVAPMCEAVFGAGQDELLAYYDYVSGTDYLPVRDWRNNVVAVFDAGAEALSGHAEYSPEGRLTTFDVGGNLVCQEEGTGSVCAVPGGLPFAFNGQWRSSLTGLSYVRNRWYSPRLGQFVSHDPLHYVDSTNLYAFAGFDPVNSWDPMGLQRSAWVKIAVGVGAVAVGGYYAIGTRGNEDSRLQGAFTAVEEYGVDVSAFKETSKKIETIDGPAFLVGGSAQAAARYYPLPDRAMLPTNPSTDTVVHEMIHAIADFDEGWSGVNEALSKFYEADPLSGDDLNQESVAYYGEAKLDLWQDLVDGIRDPKVRARALETYRAGLAHLKKTHTAYVSPGAGSAGGESKRKGLPKAAQKWVDDKVFRGTVPDEPLDSAFVRKLLDGLDSKGAAESSGGSLAN